MPKTNPSNDWLNNCYFIKNFIILFYLVNLLNSGGCSETRSWTHRGRLRWATAWIRPNTRSGSCRGCWCSWRFAGTDCRRCCTRRYLWWTDSVSQEIRQRSSVQRQSCVGTFTDEQDVVVAEAHGTLAAETADLVDADAVRTDSWDLATLVDIWGEYKRAVCMKALTQSLCWWSEMFRATHRWVFRCECR